MSNVSESISITTERVDDVPLLVAQMQRMELSTLLDAHFPTHGNWSGLSLGNVTVLWLAHILSQADHRMNHVQPWAERRLQTLQCLFGEDMRALDLCDDRLADVLRLLSDDVVWVHFERELSGHLLRVYDLKRDVVRLDSTTVSSYGQVTEDGLLQFGHSKDHRPDLPQIKIMVATLDPMGMPIVTDVVSGQRADDPLYVPAIARVRTSVGTRGLLYVGDAKMAAIATRAYLAAGGDFYLCPLSSVQVSPEELDAYLARVQGREPTVVYRPSEETDGEEPVPIADGYELHEPMSALVQGQPIVWSERRLIVRSFAHAKASQKALRTRLDSAVSALSELGRSGRGKKRYPDAASLLEAAQEVVTRHKVTALVRITVHERKKEQSLRKYGSRPAQVRVSTTPTLGVELDEAALASQVARLGWRVYVTNAAPEQMSLSDALLAYRDEYRVERSLGRLKGHPLSLRPMYVEREEHATGLIRLLSIALRVLTLLEFVVRRNLAASGETLSGLYAGNAKRVTAQPTAERLLAAFEEVTLTIVEAGSQRIRHLTPLSALQQRILALLDLNVQVYSKLTVHSSIPP